MVYVKSDTIQVQTDQNTVSVVSKREKISVCVNEEPAKVHVSDIDSVSVNVDTQIIQTVPGEKAYNGPYEFTPSNETQTIQISGLTASKNITISPIPKNYGLITWNGASLSIT